MNSGFVPTHSCWWCIIMVAWIYISTCRSEDVPFKSLNDDIDKKTTLIHSELLKTCSRLMIYSWIQFAFQISFGRKISNKWTTKRIHVSWPLCHRLLDDVIVCIWKFNWNGLHPHVTGKQFAVNVLGWSIYQTHRFISKRACLPVIDLSPIIEKSARRNYRVRGGACRAMNRWKGQACV